MASPPRLPLAILATLLLLAHPAAALAAWPHSPLVGLSVSPATLDQGEPAAVSDGAGGMIIAWQDFRSGAYDIYAQRISAAGVPLWTAGGVTVCNATGAQMAPCITSDGAGGVVIAWQDFRSGAYDIYAQKFNASGARQWTTNGLAVCTATNSQLYPQAVQDSLGGAIIAWTDYRSGTNYDLYAQRVSATGIVRLGANGIAVCTAASDQQSFAMTPDGSGGTFIAWEDLRSGTDYDVYAQKLSGTGAQWAAGTGMPVCVLTPTNQNRPRLVRDGGGGVIIAWEDVRSGNFDVYAQRLDGSGAPSWTLNGVTVASGTGDQNGVHVCPDGFGGAVLAWSDARAGTKDVYAQRLDLSGGAWWKANGVAVTSASGDQAVADLVNDGAGSTIFVWTDLRNGAHRDIYARAVDATGSLMWQANGVPINTNVGDQYTPLLVTDGTGGAIAAWTDMDLALAHVRTWCGRVDHFGALGSAEPAITRVRDVPNDQGGAVQVEWTASYRDTFPDFSIWQYTVWRRVPNALAATRAFSSTPGAITRRRDGRVVLASAEGTQAVYWEQVGTQPARGLPGYSFVAATTSDSLPGSNPYTSFMVMAEEAGTTPYWMSAADSGYSVDDLAPATPAPFTGAYANGSTTMTWGQCGAPDFLEFRLYRGHEAGFVPASDNLVATQTSTGYVDAAGAPCLYKLCAVDIHGNQSPYAFLQPAGTVDVPGATLPRELALSAPAPNPLRGFCAMQLALPRAARVTLTVYDQQGRHLRTLLAGAQPAGERTIVWDGRDDGGRDVASGIYFVHCQVEGRTLTRRIAAVR
jgi:hypothetical protein